MARKNNEDENQEKKKRKFIYFPEVPFLMPLSSLQTICMEPEWINAKGGTKIEEKWSLVINKNIESSKEHPVGEVRIVYEKMETCKKKVEQIIEEISFDSYDVITL